MRETIAGQRPLRFLADVLFLPTRPPPFLNWLALNDAGSFLFANFAS